MKLLLSAIARAAFRLSVAFAVGLTFVWPFVVSPDPDQPVFKAVAIATLLVFFASTLVLLAERLRSQR